MKNLNDLKCTKTFFPRDVYNQNTIDRLPEVANKRGYKVVGFNIPQIGDTYVQLAYALDDAKSFVTYDQPRYRVDFPRFILKRLPEITDTDRINNILKGVPMFILGVNGDICRMTREAIDERIRKEQEESE